jgi:hypothetical protein
VVGRVSERVAGHYVYGVNVAVSLASVKQPHSHRTRSAQQHTRKPCISHKQDIKPYVCIKNLSLALLKMGISLLETC